MTSNENSFSDPIMTRRSDSARPEILSPRGRSVNDKPSSCLLERISRLQGRLNERMALAGQSSSEHKKSDWDRKAANRTKIEFSSLQSNRSEDSSIVTPSEGSILSHPIQQRPEIICVVEVAGKHVRSEEERVIPAGRSTGFDSKVERDLNNPIRQQILTQFSLTPRSRGNENFRSKEEEIECLSMELKNMQEKVIRMERKAQSSSNEIDASIKIPKPFSALKENLNRVANSSVSTQTELASHIHLSEGCGKCQQLQRELNEVVKRCDDETAKCATMSSWIQEVNDAVNTCRSHVLVEKVYVKPVIPSAKPESSEIKRVLESIVLEMDKLVQYFDAAHDQLHVAHCLENILKAQAIVEAKSPLPVSDQMLNTPTQIFPQALLWVKRALAIDETLKDKDKEIARLTALAKSNHLVSTETNHKHPSNPKELPLRPAVELKTGELEAEMSLLRGRVKALTHELEIAKSRSRKLKTIAYSEDDECFDERDEVEARHLEQHEPLGTGAFAEVFKGWWRRPVAIKKFRNLTTQSKLDSFAREVRIHRPLDHPGIVQYYGVCTDLPDMYILLEYVSGTSFHKLCHERNGELWDTDEILGLCLQLSDVMCYVHSQNVVHRDLKPPNVLVSEAGFVKLIDFGLSYAGDPSRIPKSSVYAGTPVYLPPEVLREEVVTSKVDLYSFAVILWEMMAQDLPWKGVNMTQMIAAVATRDERPPIPATMRSDVQDLIRGCWAADPAHRPEFEEVSRSLREMGAPPAPIRQKPQFQTIQAM